MEPQINADERRFVDLKIQRFSNVYPAKDANGKVGWL